MSKPADGDVEMKDVAGDTATGTAAAAAPSTPDKTSNGKPKPKLNTSPSPTGRQPIVYRWVGPGTYDANTGSTIYTQLEMRVGGRAALIRTGDCALLCSGDVTEDVLYGGTPTARGGGGDDNENKNNGGDVDMADADGKKADGADDNRGEDDLLYGGAATCFDDVAISQLDPFVARIERMWEDHPDHTAEESPGARQRREQDKMLFGRNYDERRSRMKIQARWFYKKEDISGLTSHFVGVSRKELLATMTPRELILGDQADDNEVSTILGKCRVVSRPPLPKGAKSPAAAAASGGAGGTEEEAELPVGAFACRYGLTLHPPSRAGAAGTVVFSPYDGQDPGLDDGDATGSTIAGKRGRDAAVAGSAEDGGGGGGENTDPEPDSKRRRTDSDAGSASLPSSPPTSRRTSDAGRTTASSSSSSDEEEIANETDTGEGPPVTEGSQLHGSIHVGNEHQVIIPPLNKDLALKDRGAVRVWSPDGATEEQVDEYLKKAADVLKAYMKQRGLEVDPSTTIYEFEKGLATAAPPRDADGTTATAGQAENTASVRKPRPTFRECDVDRLLATFHECNYNADNAIKAVEIAPDEYLTIWNKQQKETFNAGFRRYYGSLRMIGKGVGRTKNHKDVVDYFYRFKIPEQFCKYKDRKREQAKRILQTVEKRRMRDALAAEDGDDAKSTTSVTSSKKTKDLAKTLGSPSSVGQVEKRRVMARDLLSVIRDTVGPQNYLKICKLLKANQTRKGSSIPALKDRAEEILGDHPELLDRFVAFLPKKHR